MGPPTGSIQIPRLEEKCVLPNNLMKIIIICVNKHAFIFALFCWLATGVSPFAEKYLIVRKKIFCNITIHIT